ncbi:MAG: hypothetical protein EOO77_22915 [Oxalobacteraceae bacterium]|nr:MAG: hypothetical protein EOO77_22915 [Oxalobacteraceae bacterium]
MAAAIKAQVEARYIVALRRPRDIDHVREVILKDCRRPGFADGAMYELKRGKEPIRGLTIRYAESAMQAMTNMECTTMTIYDDKQKRIVRVQVVDLESNATAGKDITIEKTQERSFLKQGQVPLGVRKNSRGQNTYVVEATDDEVTAKEGNLASRAKRNLILSLVPGYIKEESEDLIRETMRTEAATDPDAHKRRLLDGFSRLGINSTALKGYLGRTELDSMSPDELTEMRGLFTSIRDGHATWNDLVAEREAERADGKEPEPKLNRTKAALAKLKPNEAALTEEIPDMPKTEQRPKREPEPDPWEKWKDGKPEG